MNCITLIDQYQKYNTSMRNIGKASFEFKN